jgi:hypothetical protein
MFDFDTKGLETYTTDPVRESQGVWVDFPAGRSMLVLRAGGSNKAFIRGFQAAIRPFRRQIEKGTMDVEKSDEMMREMYARYVVKDWSGITDKEGKPVPYSPEAAVAFFRAFPELFQDLMAIASDANTFNGMLAPDVDEAKEIMGEA